LFTPRRRVVMNGGMNHRFQIRRVVLAVLLLWIILCMAGVVYVAGIYMGLEADELHYRRSLEYALGRLWLWMRCALFPLPLAILWNLRGKRRAHATAAMWAGGAAWFLGMVLVLGTFAFDVIMNSLKPGFYMRTADWMELIPWFVTSMASQMMVFVMLVAVPAMAVMRLRVARPAAPRVVRTGSLGLATGYAVTTVSIQLMWFVAEAVRGHSIYHFHIPWSWTIACSLAGACFAVVYVHFSRKALARMEHEARMGWRGAGERREHLRRTED